MGKIRIGTRESQLAIWQAEQVKNLLAENGFESELVYIKTEGDLDLVTPLYEIGVQGIFTRSLDAALLSKRIDIAVHSMKDVPVQPAKGIQQAAVLKRGSYKDVFVPHPTLDDPFPILELGNLQTEDITVTEKSSKFTQATATNYHPTGEKIDATIATSSVRRIAQWLHRFPNHKIENLRGNVNTRLRKLNESNWFGAIFAAAGLERIGLRPKNAIDIDWMLPAPAQGAILVVCREDDTFSFDACNKFNDSEAALCTKVERDFLKTLMGGCSTPISALAEIKNGELVFKGNILSPDGKMIAEASAIKEENSASDAGVIAARKILENGGQAILEKLKDATN
jgi:hydroxymethylbilane synthase